MIRYIVKVTQSEGQTRITIPRLLALATDLDKAKVVEMTWQKNGSLKIKEYHGEKENDGSL